MIEGEGKQIVSRDISDWKQWMDRNRKEMNPI